jgi:hypothetical protein
VITCYPNVLCAYVKTAAGYPQAMRGLTTVLKAELQATATATAADGDREADAGG